MKFRDYFESAVDNKSYVKLQYFTDIHEFVTTMAVVKALTVHEGKEMITLVTGEQIPLDRIVRINDEVAPQYVDIMDFTCDC